MLVDSQTLEVHDQNKSRDQPCFYFGTKKLPRLDYLGALALNVTTVFASKNSVLFRKTPPHSARAPLEPQARCKGTVSLRQSNRQFRNFGKVGN